MSTIMRSLAVMYLVLLIGAPGQLMADADSSWENAVPVQLRGSNIEVLAVRSTWATDYDYARQMQGPVYFNDCVVFENRAPIAATHVQFIFALVDSSGELKTSPLPLDVRYSSEPDKREDQAANCRDHAYANGADGYWLAAWVNRVDFADGSSWNAPAGDELRAAIRAAFPRRIQF